MPANQIQYSEKYYDDVYEYRHVVLPSDIAKLLPKGVLLSENEWRQIGVQQSRGWVHYAIHRPEPHIMLFRRPINYQQNQAAAAQAAQKAQLQAQQQRGLLHDIAQPEGCEAQAPLPLMSCD